MVNKSQASDPRCWEKWRKSGAVGSTTLYGDGFEKLDYVRWREEFLDNNVVTCDGLRKNTLVYCVSRRSDRKALMESTWDLSNQKIFIGDDSGTIVELRSRGHSDEEIFEASVEASGAVRPVDRFY